MITNENNINILNRVKALILADDTELFTAEQVANYYNVPLATIDSCYSNNKDELDEDGVFIKSASDFLNAHYTIIEQTDEYTVFKLADNILFKVPTAGIRCFSQRAVLRFGMLLDKNTISKEVRTQELNIFQHTSPEQKQATLNEELNLRTAFNNAVLENEPVKMFEAYNNLQDFKQFHINN